MSWKNADCHELLTEGLRKSDERDQELQDASQEIERLKKSVTMTDSKRIKINMNDFAFVRLTDEGRDEYRRWHAGLFGSPTGLTREHEPAKEINGVSRWTLWELANVFGNVLYHGNSTPPFAMSIEIERNVIE